MSDRELPGDLKSMSYELFILLLSLLSLFNIFLILLPNIDPLVKGVVSLMDFFITLIFLVDFLYRLFTASSKREYFLRDWGWADLLASLPIQMLKIFRVFRVVKVVRLLRVFGPRRILHEVRENRAGSAMFLTIFLVIAVLEFGGSLIVAVEAGNPEANIKSAGDGVWWAFVTITTVGYGDRYPVTPTGRLFGMLTMMLGVGLFGVLTGFLANAFIPPKEGEPKQVMAGEDSPIELRDFKRLLEEQERVTAELKFKLAQVERLMENESR
ncbi:MAG: potassium channel family protein [Anaerolineales bacterium]